jgi:hypothetical protein
MSEFMGFEWHISCRIKRKNGIRYQEAVVARKKLFAKAERRQIDGPTGSAVRCDALREKEILEKPHDFHDNRQQKRCPERIIIWKTK